jgi:hypothetical protein
METEIESYLCRSALVQKGLSKLPIYRRERSQGGAVMGRRVYVGSHKAWAVQCLSTYAGQRAFLAQRVKEETSLENMMRLVRDPSGGNLNSKTIAHVLRFSRVVLQ